jgi:hypothetical protein
MSLGLHKKPAKVTVICGSVVRSARRRRRRRRKEEEEEDWQTHTEETTRVGEANYEAGSQIRRA